MSKRVTLQQEDIELIIAALKHLHKDSIINPTVYPEYAMASKQRIEQVESKLTQHRDSL